MKIIYVYTALTTVGGADRVLVQKANWLAEHGHDVTIVTESQAGKPIAFPLSDKTRHVDLGVDFDEEYGHTFLIRGVIYLKLMRAYKKKLKRFIIDQRPDIVITTLGRDLGIVVKMKDGSIKIGETHTTQYHLRNFHLMEQRGGIYKWLAIFLRYRHVSLARQLKVLVVLTPEDEEDWKSVTTTCVIPNSVSFYPKETARLENKQVIMVGRYNDAKGYDYLIPAWKTVHLRHPDWVLNVYGSGELYNDVVRWIKEYQLDNSVILHEPTDRIMEKYLESSVCVLSSRYEGFSLVILEGMACGVPFVSFDCPYGPRNIIHDGEDGFLVEYLNSEALADKLCKLIENPGLRKKMGDAAKRNVKRFCQDEVMMKWRDLFESLIETRCDKQLYLRKK